MGKQRSIFAKLGLTGAVFGLSLFLVACGDGALVAYGAALTGNTPASTLDVWAASGATIEFQTQNGQMVDGIAPQSAQIPHLVLYRNGMLTAAPERTLVVRVPGLDVPTGGMTVTLSIETQHSDPDQGEDAAIRIPVWHESRWIAGSGSLSSGDTAEFVVEFSSTVTSGPDAIATPTGYFHYQVAATNVNETTSRTLIEKDYAFLMENQVVVSLPQVQEITTDAAPDTLVIYYCDMFPYQNSTAEGTIRLHRADIYDFVQGHLIPRMVEAFRSQTDDWGFPWYEAWTSYRNREDVEKLSVTLSDGEIWFHGTAPTGGNAGISLNVSDNIGSAHYASLTERLISIYQHELFHNLQRNMALHYGKNGEVAGKDRAWQNISEGTAVLASSAGETHAEYSGESGESYYILNANKFVGGGGLNGELNTRFPDMDAYTHAVYWRFLYEQCGNMQIIREVLKTLYAGTVVDPWMSTDLVSHLPAIMDHALASASCPFSTYRESMNAFARALYALHIEGGRCAEPGQSGPCGLYDPNHLYSSPTTKRLAYTGAPLTYSAATQPYPAGIPSSFGMDFIEIDLDQATDGQPLTVEVAGVPGAAAVFDIQVWALVVSGDHLLPAGEAVSLMPDAEGHLLYAFPALDSRITQRLAVIITRVDAEEQVDPVGAYTLYVYSGIRDS